MPVAAMTRLQADLAIAGCAAIWGLAFLFQKAAVDHVGPATFVAARLLLATLALAPFAWLEARRATRPAPPGMTRVVLPAGAALLGGLLFQQIGIASATVTNTGLLTGLYAVLTPLIAWVLLGRRASVHVWLAAVLCVVGVPMLGGGTVGGFGPGDAMVAVCAVFWAVHLLLMSAAAVEARPIGFTCLHMGVAALGACALAGATETIELSGLVAATPAIVYAGLLSSALTYAVLAAVMGRTTPAEAAILASLEVVFAAASGAIVLGERLAPIGWAGAALMISAALIVQIAPHLKRGG